MLAKTLNISLPQTLIVKVDDLAKKRDAHRSELIRDALRTYIAEYAGQQQHRGKKRVEDTTRQQGWQNAAATDASAGLGIMPRDEFAYYESL